MTLDPDELLQLKRNLQADDPALRDAAVQQMPAVVAKSVLPALAEALRSDSVEVRRQALLLLGRLGDVDHRVLSDAMSVISEQRGARAALEGFLDDSDPDVRRIAADMLEPASGS